MAEWSVEAQRAKDSRRLGAFYRGDTDVHPLGELARVTLTAPEDARHCRDTSARAYEFSEYGNAAGFTPEMINGGSTP